MNRLTLIVLLSTTYSNLALAEDYAEPTSLEFRLARTCSPLDQFSQSKFISTYELKPGVGYRFDVFAIPIRYDKDSVTIHIVSFSGGTFRVKQYSTVPTNQKATYIKLEGERACAVKAGPESPCVLSEVEQVFKVSKHEQIKPVNLDQENSNTTEDSSTEAETKTNQGWLGSLWDWITANPGSTLKATPPYRYEIDYSEVRRRLGQEIAKKIKNYAGYLKTPNGQGNKILDRAKYDACISAFEAYASKYHFEFFNDKSMSDARRTIDESLPPSGPASPSEAEQPTTVK